MKANYLLPFALLLFSCNQMDKLNNEPITIKAHFMQYACGDWNDDMKVYTVSDTTYQFIVGKEIDPVMYRGKRELSGWFFDNKTEEFGMSYRMTGFISKCAKSGCSKGAPKFWITEIKKMNGEAFDTSGRH